MSRICWICRHTEFKPTYHCFFGNVFKSFPQNGFPIVSLQICFVWLVCEVQMLANHAAAPTKPSTRFPQLPKAPWSSHSLPDVFWLLSIGTCRDMSELVVYKWLRARRYHVVPLRLRPLILCVAKAIDRGGQGRSHPRQPLRMLWGSGKRVSAHVARDCPFDRRCALFRIP